MPQVTALEAVGTRGKRMAVYLDGQRALTVARQVAAGIWVGQELSPEEVAALEEEDAVAAAYQRSLGFLSHRPRSTAEVERYLARRGVESSVALKVVERLKGIGLLDDQAFARLWVEDREAFNPKGRRALRYELRRKGVAGEIISQALEGLDEESGAYRATRPHLARYAGLQWWDFQAKLGGYLSRRGFGYPAIRATLKRLWREKEMLEGKEGEGNWDT